MEDFQWSERSKMISLPEELTLLSKWQSKELTFAYKKNWCALTFSKNLLCIIIIIGTVIKQGLGNCIDINFCPCDLLYLSCTICHASNFFCSCVRTIARVQSLASHRKACLNFLTFLSEEPSDLLILNWTTFYYLSRFIK